MKALLLTLCLIAFSAYAESIKVITHEATPFTSLSKTQIRDYFLKKNKYWPNGTSVRFFDRNDDSAERKIFLKDVVKRSQREVETFWIGQKLYTGHSAPTQVSSDNMMAAMVAKFPGSLGYVSETFSGARGVKFLEVTEK